MKKDSIYDVIRSSNDFAEAFVIVFAFGDDGSYSRSAEGHWLIFAVDLVKKTVYCYCSSNRHPWSGPAPLIDQDRVYSTSSFVLERKTRKVDQLLCSRESRSLDKECTEGAQSFNLCNVMLPTVPVEDYSYGFWEQRSCCNCALIRYRWWMGSKWHSILMSTESTCISWCRHDFWHRWHLKQSETSTKITSAMSGCITCICFGYSRSISTTTTIDPNDNKSDISALTIKTTRGGNTWISTALCKFKLIPGKKWSRNHETFHKDVEAQTVKCSESCTHCDGKY